MSTNLVLHSKKDVLVDYLRFVFNSSHTDPVALGIQQLVLSDSAKRIR